MFSPHRHPGHRSGPAHRVGLRHLAGGRQVDHRRRAHRLPHLHFAASTRGSIPMSRIVSLHPEAAAGISASSTSSTTSPACLSPVKPQHLPAVTGAIECRKVGFRHSNRTILGASTEHPGRRDDRPGGPFRLRQRAPLVNLICRFYDGPTARSASKAWMCARCRCPNTAATSAWCSGALPVLRHHCREHRLQQTRRHRDEIIAAARAARPRLHHAPAPRLRFAGGRARSGLSGGERQRISIARALSSTRAS